MKRTSYFVVFLLAIQSLSASLSAQENQPQAEAKAQSNVETE